VPSVDGVNAITGETASPEQSGYVLEPYGFVEIAGWRKSLANTAGVLLHEPRGQLRRAAPAVRATSASSASPVFRERAPVAYAPQPKIAQRAERADMPASPGAVRERGSGRDGRRREGGRRVQRIARRRRPREARGGLAPRHRPRPQRIVVRPSA
jgi:hypothetical protein